MLKVIEKGKEGFQHCYFFFSSLEEQNSFADKALSHFTRAVVESVHKHQADSISYADLGSAIADRFRGRQNQTPYFVQQAKLTETFATITPELRRKLGGILNPSGSGGGALDPSTPPPKPRTLVDRIKEDASGYVSREDAMKFLERVRREAIVGMFDEKLGAIYDPSVDEVPLLGIDTGPAARWLEQQPKGEFFVKLGYDTYYTDFAGNRLEGGSFGRGSAQSLVRALTMLPHADVVGYAPLEKGAWDALRIVASPKCCNLPKWQLDVIYVLGGRRCALFYRVVRLDRVGWEEFGDGSSSGWTTIDVEGARFADTEEVKIGKRLSAEILKVLAEQFAAQPGTIVPSRE